MKMIQAMKANLDYAETGVWEDPRPNARWGQWVYVEVVGSFTADAAANAGWPWRPVLHYVVKYKGNLVAVPIEHSDGSKTREHEIDPL